MKKDITEVQDRRFSNIWLKYHEKYKRARKPEMRKKWYDLSNRWWLLMYVLKKEPYQEKNFWQKAERMDYHFKKYGYNVWLLDKLCGVATTS